MPQSGRSQQSRTFFRVPGWTGVPGPGPHTGGGGAVSRCKLQLSAWVCKACNLPFAWSPRGFRCRFFSLSLHSPPFDDLVQYCKLFPIFFSLPRRPIGRLSFPAFPLPPSTPSSLQVVYPASRSAGFFAVRNGMSLTSCRGQGKTSVRSHLASRALLS